jgi:hypothetical protein
MVIVQQGLLWALVAVLLTGALYAIVMTVVNSCRVIQLRDDESLRRYRRLKYGVVDRQRTKVG